MKSYAIGHLRNVAMGDRQLSRTDRRHTGSDGTVFLVQGVDGDHKATDVLA